MKLFDSSPLIAILGNISSLELMEGLISLGYKLYAPSKVILEITNDPEKENLKYLLTSKKVEELNFIEDDAISAFRNRYPNLGRGESELILTAQTWKSEQKTFCCIIDDQLARKTAEGFGLKCKGTIGLLQKLNKEGIIIDAQLQAYYSRLEECEFRYDFKSLNVR